MAIQEYGSMIPGAQSSDGRVEVHAPFDESLLSSIEAADSTAVERALETAHQLFRNRSAWLKPWERVAILEKTAAALSERFEEFAVEAAREGGKPLQDSRVEVARAIDGLKGCVETLRTQAGEEVPMNLNPASAGKLAFTRREPIGVVVAVSAFNHPLNLIVHQVAPAVATGCPVIVKPAEDTPISCFKLVELFRDSGLPPEWCQALVVNDLKVATQLVTDRRVNFFSFIGSARVGWHLRSQLAPGTRCALEHGGAAPVIVSADANFDRMVPKLVKGGFYHAGQVCVSVQRVFAEASIARELAAELAEKAGRLVVGDPTLEETEVGPLIRTREVDRVEEWVEEASNNGAQVLTGGERISSTCYAPTVLLNPPPSAKVSLQEIFGPVICVFAYQEIDEAIARANSLPYAFQASVFTQDIDLAMHAYTRLDASAVMINEHTAFRADWMPFAGLRESGLGVGGIPYTMSDMQVEKLMVLHSDQL